MVEMKNPAIRGETEEEIIPVFVQLDPIGARHRPGGAHGLMVMEVRRVHVYDR